MIPRNRRAIFYFFTFVPKEQYETKKVEINKILVKFELNLECGNIRNLNNNIELYSLEDGQL